MMTVTADEIRMLRELTGEGLSSCKRAVELAEDPAHPCHGDLFWALCTVYASGLAVNVKPAERRAQWNIEHGASRAAMLRERFPEIAEAYPPRKAPDAPSAPTL